jgi:hypothetical protein
MAALAGPELKELPMNKMTNTAVLSCLLAASGVASSEPTRSTVELDGITNVHLLGSYDLILKQGEEEYVTIIADSEYIDEIEARVKGDTLALGEKSRSTWNWFDRGHDREVTFEVQVRDLKNLVNRGSGSVQLHPFRLEDKLELAVHGSGELSAQLIQAEEVELDVMGSGTAKAVRVEADEVDLAVHGSGDVEIRELYANRTSGDGDLPQVSVAAFGSGDIKVDEGEAQEVEITLSGSGDVDLAGVRARRAEVNINGSGDVAVHASEELDVSINGSGDVFYRGEPAEIDRSIRGSGDIRSGK